MLHCGCWKSCCRGEKHRASEYRRTPQMKKVVHENLRAADQRLVIILSGGRSDMPGNDCQIKGKQYRTIAAHALLESYFAIRTLHYAVLPEKISKILKKAIDKNERFGYNKQASCEAFLWRHSSVG
ncbi:MAG: hypothetical protein PUB99_09925 [Oscillospiraceae bacterium]|nr:hypothetical protein [Oscillospiraceae bacterium]